MEACRFPRTFFAMVYRYNTQCVNCARDGNKKVEKGVSFVGVTKKRL